MPIHRPRMDEALQQQMERWHEVEQRRIPARDIDVRVITFSREVGSGGRLIAARVAQILDLPFYDREIIQLIDQGGDHSAVNADDLVVRRWAREAEDELSGGDPRGPLELPPGEYRERLRRVIEAIADGDGGVVLGRGAHFILPRERCLRVRVVAPLDIRAEYLAAMAQVTREEARAAAARGDARRRAFTRETFDADVDDATHYDLVVNMDLYSLDAAVVLVLQAWGAARQIWNL